MSAKYLLVLPALAAVLLTVQISGLQAKETNSPENSYTSNIVKISGTVTDKNGKVLPGVLVAVKGGSTGTITDMNGNYTINIPSGATLRFTYLNMNTKEIIIGNQEVIDVSLESAIE